MSAARALLAAAALGLAACGNLLGLAPPHEQIDAPPAPAIDAPPPDAAPGTLHVVVGGTGSAGVVTSDPAGISCPGTCDFTFPAGTQVTLSATTTPDEFTGFRGGPCTGDPTCALTVAGDATIYARWFNKSNIAFVSSTVQAAGSFDVPANADALCTQLAATAGLPGTTYVAWLSTSDTMGTVHERFDNAQGNGIEDAVWRRPDGRVIANTLPDFLAGQILFPPRLDEFGRDVGDDALAITDTLADGTPNGGNHCQNYASTSDPGAILAGEPVGGTGRWSSVTAISCAQPAHLYCIGARDFEGLPIAMRVDAVLFLSKGTLTGDAVAGNADQLCHDEAATHLGHPNTMAVFAPGTAPASAHFTGLMIQGHVVRPDNTLVADTMTALFANATFLSPPDQAADGTFLDADAWLGAGSFGAFTSNCNGWSTASSSAFGTVRVASTTRGPSFAQQVSCDTAHHVFCLNFEATSALR